MSQKIVLVTAGGHIASFHAAMKRMVEVLEEKALGRFELVGAKGGLGGLIKGEFSPLIYEDIEEDRAGSLIGADREIADTDRIRTVVRENDIYALVMMAGDNHLREGAKLYQAGVNVVGYPKTMDGDLSSLITLGWESAVTVGARQTRWHHASAMTNGRVFYVGLFGRDTDWVPCAVAAYSAADRCIPAERTYNWEVIWEKINSSLTENQEKYGKKFAVVPFSEGAKITDIPEPPSDICERDKHGEVKLQPEWTGLQLVRLTKLCGGKACFQVHSYDMRDSPPTETDKRLSRRAGEECIDMILEGDFGRSVVFRPSGDFFETSRANLDIVAVKARLKPRGFFDYDELKPLGSFSEVYGNLFRASLGRPPTKDQLIYRNMAR